MVVRTNTNTNTVDQSIQVLNLDRIVMVYLLKLDHATLAHCQRTREISLLIGKRMGLNSNELQLLGLGALLHDIGKSCIPLAILTKRTPVSSTEWELIQTHPQEGYRYIEAADLDDIVKQIVLGHHRWANGRGGYPLDPDQSQPSLFTQIVTVADVVDAITSQRPYRPALNVEYCIAYLEQHLNTLFNREIVSVFKSIKSLHTFENN